MLSLLLRMCTKQWGLDPREALGVAALGSTTPTCRGPDSRTGIRNIQFLLPELLLRSLIQPLHRVTTPAQHRLSSLLNHVPTVLILHSLVSSLIGSPDQNCVTLKRAALALPHPTVFLGLGHFSSMGWREEFLSPSLWACERGCSPIDSFLQHFLLGSTGISPVSCHLKTHALPRKFRCLIWHRKFLSGARHWALTHGTAEQQTFMSRALSSSLLQGAQKIWPNLITALTVCVGSQRQLYRSTCLLPGWSLFEQMWFCKREVSLKQKDSKMCLLLQIWKVFQILPLQTKFRESTKRSMGKENLKLSGRT